MCRSPVINLNLAEVQSSRSSNYSSPSEDYSLSIGESANGYDYLSGDSSKPPPLPPKLSRRQSGGYDNLSNVTSYPSSPVGPSGSSIGSALSSPTSYYTKVASTPNNELINDTKAKMDLHSNLATGENMVRDRSRSPLTVTSTQKPTASLFSAVGNTSMPDEELDLDSLLSNIAETHIVESRELPMSNNERFGQEQRSQSPSSAVGFSRVSIAAGSSSRSYVGVSNDSRDNDLDLESLLNDLSSLPLPEPPRNKLSASDGFEQHQLSPHDLVPVPPSPATTLSNAVISRQPVMEADELEAMLLAQIGDVGNITAGPQYSSRMNYTNSTAAYSSVSYEHQSHSQSSAYGSNSSSSSSSNGVKTSVFTQHSASSAYSSSSSSSNHSVKTSKLTQQSSEVSSYSLSSSSSVATSLVATTTRGDRTMYDNLDDMLDSGTMASAAFSSQQQATMHMTAQRATAMHVTAYSSSSSSATCMDHHASYSASAASATTVHGQDMSDLPKLPKKVSAPYGRQSSEYDNCLGSPDNSKRPLSPRMVTSTTMVAKSQTASSWVTVDGSGGAASFAQSSAAQMSATGTVVGFDDSLVPPPLPPKRRHSKFKRFTLI